MAPHVRSALRPHGGRRSVVRVGRAGGGRPVPAEGALQGRPGSGLVEGGTVCPRQWTPLPGEAVGRAHGTPSQAADRHPAPIIDRSSASRPCPGYRGYPRLGVAGTERLRSGASPAVSRLGSCPRRRNLSERMNMHDTGPVHGRSGTTVDPKGNADEGLPRTSPLRSGGRRAGTTGCRGVAGSARCAPGRVRAGPLPLGGPGMTTATPAIPPRGASSGPPATAGRGTVARPAAPPRSIALPRPQE